MAFDHILRTKSKAVSVHTGLDVWDVFSNKYLPACHPHLLLLLSRKHEVCSSSYVQFLSNVSSKKAEDRSAARERNSFLLIVVFRSALG